MPQGLGSGTARMRAPLLTEGPGPIPRASPAAPFPHKHTSQYSALGCFSSASLTALGNSTWVPLIASTKPGGPQYLMGVRMERTVNLHWLLTVIVWAFFYGQ